ncbi:MAG: RHS repeat-associated core domain-containing protein [Pseudomonadota bacterium]
MASAATAGTTTTEYAYNADGALTAMTVTDPEGAAQTTFLTWDNYTPDQANPSTGTLAKANGRLVGMAPQPGAASAFRFDVRDRLTGQGSDATAQTYGYHANNLLANAALGDQSRSFYQGSGKHPAMHNIVESRDSNTRRSAQLGSGRYLSDGTEQVLVNQRKDTDGVFSPSDRTLARRSYDPFGGQPDETLATAYDLTDNPFQYAGEYRDPIWGGVYLRARWYDPNLAQFISRDPMPHLNRYAYGGGNPVMNIDPGGMNFFQSLNKDLNKGVWGHLDRFFLAPLMGPLAIAANPEAFWKQIKQDKGGIDIFLGAGVAVEVLSMGAEGFGLSATWRNLGLGTRFGTRLVLDGGLGVGQAVAAGAERGKGHFDWTSFGNTLEMSGGMLGWSRGVIGVGYNPFTLTADDVVTRVEDMTDSSKLLVFRERTQGYAPWRGTNTSPLAEWLRVGTYHERLIAVSQEQFLSNELFTDGGGTGSSGTGFGSSRGDALGGIKKVQFDFETGADDSSALTMSTERDSLRESFAGRKGRYQFVGEIDKSQAITFHANPKSYPDIDALSGPNAQNARQYSLLTNNCQHHAAAVLRQLSVR